MTRRASPASRPARGLGLLALLLVAGLAPASPAAAAPADPPAAASPDVAEPRVELSDAPRARDAPSAREPAHGDPVPVAAGDGWFAVRRAWTPDEARPSWSVATPAAGVVTTVRVDARGGDVASSAGTPRAAGATPPVMVVGYVANLTVAVGEPQRVQVEVVNPEDAVVFAVPHLRLVESTWTSPARAPPPPEAFDAIRYRLESGPGRFLPGEAQVVTFSILVPEGVEPGWAMRFAVEGDVPGRDRPLRLHDGFTVLAAPPPPAPRIMGAVTAEESLPLATLVALAVAAGAAVSTVAAVALHRREDVHRWLLLTPLVGLFTRLVRQDVLSQGTRDRLHRLVKERPGVNYSALLAETGLAPGVLLHHLRVLEQHRILTSRKEGGRRCFYLVGARLPPPAAPAPTGTQALVLDLVRREPLSQGAIARRLGITQQAASYHLRALAAKGLLPAGR